MGRIFIVLEPARPDGLFDPVVARKFESRSIRMVVIEVVHIQWPTVQEPGMCSAVYGAMHYKEPL